MGPPNFSSASTYVGYLHTRALMAITPPCAKRQPYCLLIVGLPHLHLESMIQSLFAITFRYFFMIPSAGTKQVVRRGHEW